MYDFTRTYSFSACGAGVTYTEQQRIWKQWDKAIDFGSPISSWTLEMLQEKTMIENHITYWVKGKVLYYRTSSGSTGSQPVSDTEERELEKLIKSLGFKHYTLEKI